MTPSNVDNSSLSQNVWERTAWLWTGTFVLSLVFSLVLGLREPDMTADQHLQMIGLITILLLIHTGMVVADRYVENLRERLPLTLGYVISLIFIWYLLLRLHPLFYFVLFGLFGQLFFYLSLRWASAASLLVFALMLYHETWGVGRPFSWTLALIYGAMGLTGIIMGSWIDAIIRQSSERKELIEQLEATQTELAAAEHRAGMLAERQRLAHEIHDTLAQGFISIVMHLEAAEQALVGDETVVQKHIGQARETARSGLEQARRLVQDLRPEPLEQASLPEAIVHVAQNWGQQSGVAVETAVTGDPYPLPAQLEVTLLRAAQEALANIRRHAQASETRLTLSYMSDVVMLDVQDNGVGLNGNPPVPNETGGGFGLTGMRRRVTQVGGTLLLESEPGEGTTLVVSIPVARTADAREL